MWWRRTLALVAVVAGVLVGGGLPGAAASDRVVVLTAKGAVSPVMAMYLDRGISAAEEEGAAAVVVQLDTPGGLDSSMRDIVQRINRATVPVVVYVAPVGGRAASAGAFITMAGHVAAMAPNTAIGAAHPVGGGGAEIKGPLADKVTNDAVAYIRGIAALRGRNLEWAEKAVRESVSATADEAVQSQVVDLVAADLESLLRQIDGRTVSLATGPVTLRTAGLTLVPLPMNPIESFLSALADPNVAYLLLSLAMTGLFLELSNPGAILPGIVGGIALLLAMFSLGMLPVNISGLLLILFAFLLFLADVWVTSHGMLTVGGAISLTLGSFLLMSSNDPALRVNPFLIAGVVGTITVLSGLMVTVIVRSYRTRPVGGPGGVLRMVGVARTPLEPEGLVFVHGELWRARSEDGRVEQGERVRIVGLSGLELRVNRASLAFDDLLGSVGVAQSPLNPAGKVAVAGLQWDARSDGGAVEQGERVRVTGLEGSALTVVKAGEKE